jgi:hypothetical protein
VGSKAGLLSNQIGVFRGRPWASGDAAFTETSRRAPGQKKSVEGASPLASAFLTGKPRRSIAKSAAASRATSVPPSSTKARNAFTPSAPRPPVYSSGNVPVPCPLRSVEAGWLGRTIASKRARRWPARTSRSWSVSWSTLTCFSKTNRVQPSSIDGTHER